MCNCKGTHRHLPKGTSRRDILKFGALAAGISLLGPWRGALPLAHGSPVNRKRFVVLNLFGGNDSMNMVIPHALQPYYDRRPGLAVEADDALSLNQGANPNATYSLHPQLSSIRQMWNDGDAAIIHRVGYPAPNLSHFTSQDIYSNGFRGEFPTGIPESGWIARYADRNGGNALSAVSVGVGRPRDFVGGQANPFLVQSLSSFNLVGGTGNSHLHRLETAKRIIESFAGTGNSDDARNALEQAHTLTDQVQLAVADYTSTATYTTARISRQLKDIAIMVQAGFDSSLFFTGYGGFDTHGDQLTRHASLMLQLDDAIGSFAQDMKDMGQWNDLVICVMTEFGRRNFVNGSSGTDHGHAYAELIIGGGVQGGVYGPDLVETDITANFPTHAVDFRSVYKEILTGHMGAADVAGIFPETIPGDQVLGIV